MAHFPTMLRSRLSFLPLVFYDASTVKEGEERPSETPKAEFGTPLNKQHGNAGSFTQGEDLPLFSGTPQEAIDAPFLPTEPLYRQQMLPDMLGSDADRVLATDRVRPQRRRKQGVAPVGDIFVADAVRTREQVAASKPDLLSQAKKLREALAPYLNVRQLRRLASENMNLYEALTQGNPPKEVLALLDTLAVLLRPLPREQITRPADIAALLMVEMGHLHQEQLRVVCLNTKNYVQGMHMVYQGNVNSSIIRVSEVFREPMRLNSTSIITAHNHPSGDPTPSPEDVMITRQLVAAGKLLDIDVLDHLVIGQGLWVSLRERQLGFDLS